MASSCAVPDCTAPVRSSGLCYAHYMKSWRYGDPLYRAPSRAADLTGQTFGDLTAVRRMADGRWLCACTCGNTTLTRIGDLRRGSARSCGARPTHPRKAVTTYAGAHDRVEAARGRASRHECIDCGQPAQHWSYCHTDPDELTEMQGRYLLPYSLNPQHYEPRCIPCHRRFDRTDRHAAGVA